MSFIQIKADKDVFILKLDDLAKSILKRWTSESSREPITNVQQLENLITNLFENKIHEYNNLDGPLMAKKYDLLNNDQKKTIDDILSTVTIPISERDR